MLLVNSVLVWTVLLSGRAFAMRSLAGIVLELLAAFGQRDLPRQTVAITYPLDQTVALKFRGTTLLPRLSGEGKVRRAGRRLRLPWSCIGETAFGSLALTESSSPE